MKKILSIASLGLMLTACGGSPESRGGSTSAAPPQGDVTIKVISNRPDMISGNDALIEVQLNSANALADLILLRNGQDVTNTLQATNDPNRLFAVVEGMQVGQNIIAASNGNSLTVTNHPIGGPVFTGRQIQPWQCQGGALDDQCNQPVEYELLYRSSDSSQTGLQPYDPNNPPSDVAMTTTDTGEIIPFIVRKETGYQARDQYVIFNLWKENEPWTPAQPQSQWTRQLLVTHGGNCRGHHSTSTPRVEDYAGTIPPNAAIASSYITALGKGWSVLSTSQLNLGHNCNLSYQAESLMMAKERFIEQYGELRYTIGTGCSGGAITQNMIANAYPGLYQALLTTCTYPDVMSTATQFADYHILLRYFADASRQAGLDFTAFENLIYDHPNGGANAQVADSALFSEAVNPASNCNGVSEAERFDQDTNPTGVRCDVLTFMLNMVGRRQMDAWIQMERDQGFGFAGFPLGNEGVQYGLVPLQMGILTPAHFLELNTQVGSLDANLNVKPERLVPDQPALPNAYRTGILNTAVNIDTVPILNFTGPDPGIAHDSVHAYWLRHRLDREFGHHDNHVMWGGPTPLIGDANFMNMGLDAMAEWLDAIEADTSNTPLATKIIANKPANMTDKCSNGSGVFVDENNMCSDEQMMVYGTPRTAAGNGPHGDQVQCVLRPFNRNDNYGQGNLVWQEADWQRLEATFATGVCDWDQKPRQWQPTITWLTYQDDTGDTITGGEQMPRADFPQGWASPAFANTWEPGWQTQ